MATKGVNLGSAYLAGGKWINDLLERSHCSTIHSRLYCNATSAASSSVLVRSTHVPP